MAAIESWEKLSGGACLEGLTVAGNGALWLSDVIGRGASAYVTGQTIGFDGGSTMF